MADYENRLDKLGAELGIGVPQHIVILPGEDRATKLAVFRRERGLSDDHPVVVHLITFPEWPIRGE